MRTFQVGTLLCLLLLTGSDARRVRVRPVRPVPEEAIEQDQPQVFDQEEQGGDTYNGLYGRSIERAEQEPQQQYIRPSPRTALLAAQPTRATPRVKDTPREPPVQTIRNYSKVNDDGSFTFGYEAADGSFKEETRGTDCVVRGKYGYVDPDGNKREFTYVSGNPCDPNAPQEEEEKEAADEGEENIPVNLPRRPAIRPVARPAPAGRPATTVFQQSYSANDEEDQEEQVFVQPTPTRLPQPTPGIVRVTPRPTPKASQLPATTYRPQLLVSVTPRPTTAVQQFTKQTTLSQPSTLNSLSFDEELKRFQISNAVTTPQPATLKTAQPTGQPVYTSELVYDPSSGQYNTVVYQQLPKSQAEPITLKTRLPQYVPPPTQPTLTPNNLLQQQLFQQQKQNLFQQSQDLYNQQRLQQLQHRFQTPAATKSVTAPQTFAPARPVAQAQQRPDQQFYYFTPQSDLQGQGLSQGQIDAFLRGHNLPPF